MNNKFHIQCFSAALKKDEMLALIPQEIKNQLKTFDANYEDKLKPYTLCHEGDARPAVFDGDSKKAIVMRWTRDTVKAFTSKLKLGLQFFDGHNPTNDKQTNNKLGSLIAFGEKVINGVFSAIGIGYFPNPDHNLDVVSAEFDVLTDGLVDNGSYFTVIADAIGDITALALGSRKAGMKPAFPGAESLAIQAFEFTENKIGDKILTREEVISTLTIDDIKRVIRERDLRVTQTHDSNSIFKVKKNDDGTKRIKFTDESLQKAFEDHLEDAIIISKSKIEGLSELETKYKTLEKSYSEVKPYVKQAKTDEIFSQISKAKNLEQNPKKLEFIKGKTKKSVDKFDGDISMLNKHIEELVEEYSNDFEETTKLLNKSEGFQPVNLGEPASNAANPQNDKFTL